MGNAADHNSDRLVFGNLGTNCVHLCVDMQNMFREGTPWAMAWMPRVLPRIQEITAAHPSETIFTRFIPAARPGCGHGVWRRYFERWPDMTLERLRPDMLDLVPELAAFAPPAEIVDKHVYGPWMETDLHQRLQARSIDTLIITGGETDVCVLATVWGAVDLGYRVVVVKDALCSSKDSTHDAILEIFHHRYFLQIEPVSTSIVLAHWP